MRMAMMQVCEIQQVQVMDPAAACQSIFPYVEELLEATEYQEALKYVSSRTDMEDYRCMIDYLFAQSMGTHWRRQCFRFYDGHGSPLRDRPQATVQQVAAWEIYLIHVLDQAHAAMEEQRKISWVAIRRKLSREVLATVMQDAQANTR